MNLKITDLIYRQNNFLNKNECDFFINLFEKYSYLSNQEKSLKYLENKEHLVEIDNFKCLNLNLHFTNEEIKNAAFKAWEYILKATQNYVNYLKLNISNAIDMRLINSTSNIRILKYSKGSLIKDHLDVDFNIRASCTINLNEQYLGGEFTFFSNKHVEILKTGDAMLFPAEHIWVHGTKPIIEGTRYAINCFLHNQVK